MTTFTPRVIDISHHNTVSDLKVTASAGIWGVIHKASQGSGYRDRDYPKRRPRAVAAGVLWGAYHFCDGSPVGAQVDNFIEAAAIDDQTLIALDFEDYPKSNMTIGNLVKMLRLVEQRVGRKAVVYGGNRIKEHVHELSADDRTYLCQHELWLCQYGPVAEMPMGFTSYFLWQFTDGQRGPQPRGISGVTGLVDLNRFDGTREELEARWAPAGAISVRAQRAEDDDDVTTSRAQRAEEDGDTSPAPSTNVRPQTAKYSVDVEIVQTKLKSLGYFEVGEVDGRWGGKTRAAIAAFFNDRHVTAPPAIGDTLSDTLSDAVDDGWTRPIADTRANATAEDIAPKNEAVRVSIWNQLLGKIAAAAAAVGLTGSSVSSLFSSAQDKLSPVHDALSKIPPEIWLLIIGGIAVTVYYANRKIKRAVVKDYNTGRLN